MRLRTLPSGALVLALLIGAIGCRNSSKVQVSQTQPIPVTPPALFKADQLPKDKPAEFLIAGKTGQFLQVKVNEPQGAQTTSEEAPGAISLVKIMPAGAGASELQGEAVDCVGSELYRLPQTGSYRVHFEPAGPGLGVSFTTVNANDPLVNPGIKPDQPSLDFGSFPKTEFTLVPKSVSCGEIADDWPAHLAANDQAMGIRVMSVARYKEMFGDAAIAALEAALRTQGKNADARKLPEAVSGDVGLILASRPTYWQGKGWRGLRWIAEYGQDTSCEFQGLTYVAEGLSEDGRFLAMMVSQVTSSAVTGRLTQQCKRMVESKGFDDRFEKEMPALFDQTVGTAPGSFQPNLNRLDAVIRSLTLKP